MTMGADVHSFHLFIERSNGTSEHDKLGTLNIQID